MLFKVAVGKSRKFGWGLSVHKAVIIFLCSGEISAGSYYFFSIGIFKNIFAVRRSRPGYFFLYNRGVRAGKVKLGKHSRGAGSVTRNQECYIFNLPADFNFIFGTAAYFSDIA